VDVTSRLWTLRNVAASFLKYFSCVFDMKIFEAVSIIRVVLCFSYIHI
jgi:hypothetical protein